MSEDELSSPEAVQKRRPRERDSSHDSDDSDSSDSSLASNFNREV